jgi:aminoglycoside phosphotransferase family enzyme/predicted kinase
VTDTTGPPSVSETHISWVFFTDDRAYKLLKPVAMPFIDHRDRTQRLESIRREYELNHEISPDVYLGTADMVENGEVADAMLIMRRLPEDRRLSALVHRPEFGTQLRAVAKSVASLHSRREPIHDAPMAGHTALVENWRDNFDAMRPHVGTVIDPHQFEQIESLVGRYLTGREDLLAARIADGFVRDVHGDLTADDIFCLDDGPRLIDCLAFNDRWRIVDVLSDIGFLIMDVHRLAGWQAAEQLMRWYQEFSNEHHPSSLAHHYVGYRAHVRAKVACFRFAQGDERSALLARRYHDLAYNHLQRARLRVIVVGGGPGVGKSTLAQNLGAHFGYPVLASDEVRKDVAAAAHDEHQFADPGEGIYDPATKRATYVELMREAELLLSGGTGVVLDATWSSNADREEVRLLAARTGAELVEVECVLDPAIAKERIARRLANPDNPSDATPDLVDYMAARREHWPEAIPVDTGAPVDKIRESALAAIEDQN